MTGEVGFSRHLHCRETCPNQKLFPTSRSSTIRPLRTMRRMFSGARGAGDIIERIAVDDDKVRRSCFHRENRRDQRPI